MAALHNPKHPVKIHFVLSARDVPGKLKGCGLAPSIADPYVKIFIKQKGDDKHSNLIEHGKTEYLNKNSNPDWFNNVFPFHWLQGIGQMWHFELMDHDTMGQDDLLGTIDVDIDEYVLQKKQELSVALSGGGTLLIKGTTPTSFRLSANALPKLDPMKGLSDPFVECYWSFGIRGPPTLFATTKVVKNAENVTWDEIIEFANYQKGTNQHWTLEVFDHDTASKHDVIGQTVIDVDAFVSGNAKLVRSLCPNNKAELIIKPVETQ